MRTALHPLLSLLALWLAAPAGAQGLRVDGSTGVPAQTLAGPHYQVGEQLGRRSGGNLFHSFQFFDLQAGESATFSLHSSGIANVISRVTGGAPSLILGSLRLQAAEGAPAFFFINPAGLLLGDGASIDVPGAFHASTAAYLRLADGSRWESGGGSSFSAAAPEAFGFVGGGANLFSSSYASGDGGLLRVRSPLISLDGGAFITSEAQAAGRSGAIELLAGEALMLQGGAAVSGVQTGSGDGGDIRLDGGAWLWLTDGAQIGVGALGSGRSGLLALRGDILQLDGGATVRHRAADLASSGDTWLIASELLRLAGAADLRMLQQGLGRSGQLWLQGARIEIVEGAGIGNNGSGLGRSGGPIALQAQSSLLVDSASIGSIGVNGAHAGDILLQAQTLTLRGDSSVSSSAGDQGGASGSLRLLAGASIHLGELATLSANTAGDADAGSILLQAPQILLDGEARINAATSGAGRGGDIELSAGERIRITEAAGLLSSTQGPGEGGRIRLHAPEVKVDGQALLFANSSGPLGGAGGAIRVEAGRLLELGGRALLDSSSFSTTGRGGQIELLSGGDLRLLAGAPDGPGPRVSALSGEGSSGQAGNLLLQAAGSLQLGAGSRVSNSSLGSGDGGSIRLLAPRIELSGASVSSSSSGGGRAGDIELRGGDIALRSGSGLFAVAGPQSSGRSGDILLQADASISVSGQSLVTISNAAQLSPAQRQQQRAGLLRLQAPQLAVERSGLSAEASGNADAGRIELRAAERLLLRHSVASTTAQNGNGGSLLAETGGLLWLEQSGLLTSVLGSSGNGGDIAIGARALLLDGGFIQANTAAADASGGAVQVAIRALVARDNRVAIGGDAPLAFDPLRPLNVIQAAAPDGVSGVVAVSNTVDLGSSLALLERRLLDAGGLGRSPCERSAGSALMLLGRGGLPGAGPWRPAATAPGPGDQPGGGCR